jgi:large subunit ribosomal protein L31
MIKKNLHPICYKTKVFYNKEIILEIITTKKELFVDIWSGNHSFYTQNTKIIDTEGRIEKFKKKYNLIK